jgi:phosphate-selective porin OprO and OprP
MQAVRILRLTRYALSLLTVAGVLAAPKLCRAQETQASSSQICDDDSDATCQSSNSAQQPQNPPQAPPPNLVDNEQAGESDEIEIPRRLVHWNEYEGPYFTIRAGGGLLEDFAAYAQDDASKEQFELAPEFKLRDFRFLLRGKLFPRLNRPITWSAGIMYDGVIHSWVLRETGIMIGFPKLKGYFFIGRTKLGFSLNKVMVGYAGWTLERFTMSDATVPILGDGIKWLGYSEKRGLLWNVGFYNDIVSKNQGFNLYHNQAVGRFAWLPIHSEEKDQVLHLGFDFLYGTSEAGQLRLRSRPEVFPAPYFLDTGTFTAKASRLMGYEAYYRRGSLLFGSEYWFDSITSPSTRNPTFHGGDVVATWVVTGESRAYNTVGGYFKAVEPTNPVLFNGGPGAWELVWLYSNTDLDGGTINGGKFWRFTQGVNWYLSKFVRLSFEYGYGRLERFNLTGGTQFFQSRVQFQL